MNLAELLLLVAATTSLTRLMTHDTITAPLRDRVLARGAERTVLGERKMFGLLPADVIPAQPDGPRWEPIHGNAVNEGIVGWYRRPAWYVRMLACARYCAPLWAALAVAGMWSADLFVPRGLVLALGLRGLHALAWPLIADQFGGSD